MIIITDRGALTVWDGARLVYERQMTVYELTALQVEVAKALRTVVADYSALSIDHRK